MELKYLKLLINSYVANLSFNRAEKANSLNEAAWEEMRSIFQELSVDPNVRVIILSGEGKHFCAGMDLETLMAQQLSDTKCDARKRLPLRDFIYKIQDCISSIEACKKPVIAAIHGGCIGGGVDIITACDMRYCTDEAYFTIKEVDLGLVADIGTLQRLPTILAPGHVAELAFTGRIVYGPEAKELGLVNKSYPHKAEMMEALNNLAEEIATKSPLVVQGIKENLLYKRDHSVEDSLKYVANYNTGLLLSSDLMEAFQAYLEKRDAKFEDL